MAGKPRSSFVLLLLLLLHLLTEHAFGQRPMYARRNGEITLTPKVERAFEEILWKWNNDKAAEFVNSEGLTEYKKFQGRLTLNNRTGELTIRNLQKTDAGRYKAEVLVDGTLQYSEFDLVVMDTVSRPSVWCEHVDSVAILRCHSEGEMTRYRWEGPQDLTTNWTDQPIEQRVSGSDSAYTCVVKNPVSEERSEAFPAERCFKGQSSVNVALVITAVVVIVLIVALPALIIWVLRVHRRRSSEAPDQVVPSRAEEENEGQALLQNHNERITGSCEDSPSEDDRNTAERVDSPAETIETHGEKERGEKQANGAPAKPESGSQSQSVDGNEMQEAGTSGAHGGEREGGKGQQEEQGNGAEDPEKKPAMARSGSGSERNAETCRQDKAQDVKRTAGSVDSAGESAEKEGADVTDVDEKEGKGAAAVDAASCSRNTSKDDGKTAGRDDSPAETVETHGEEETDEKQANGAPDEKSVTETKVDEQKDKDAERESRAAERNTGSCGVSPSEDDRKTAGHVDSAGETTECLNAGERGTNGQPTDNEDPEQNGTRTGADVTQSSGDPGGETADSQRQETEGGEESSEPRCETEGQGGSGQRGTDSQVDNKEQ